MDVLIKTLCAMTVIYVNGKREGTILVRSPLVLVRFQQYPRQYQYSRGVITCCFQSSDHKLVWAAHP